MDDKALNIVVKYALEHLDKSDKFYNFGAYIVWKCITIKEWADGIALHRDDNEIAFYNYLIDRVDEYGATGPEMEFFFDIIDCFTKLKKWMH